MVEFIKKQFRLSQTRFSFGATSAIITNLGLITGLRTLSSPRTGIIGGIFIIAVAANIADSLGIHLDQESECLKTKEVWFSTVSNFLTRFLVSLTFALIVWFLPINFAVVTAILWGMVLLSLLSYLIARREKRNPYLAIFEHIVIAVLVILLSNYAGEWFSRRFSS